MLLHSFYCFPLSLSLSLCSVLRNELQQLILNPELAITFRCNH